MFAIVHTHRLQLHHCSLQDTIERTLALKEASMYRIEQTPEFKRWFKNLKDSSTRNRLLARLARAENGNLGDHKVIDGQLQEFRMTFGGGLRVYFKRYK